MDSKAQHENAAANNGDNDIDDDALIEPPPLRHEALQAKITIEKYIETIDEPYACKLESNSAHWDPKNESLTAYRLFCM